MNNWRQILSWQEEPQGRLSWAVRTYDIYQGLHQKWQLIRTYTREDAEKIIELLNSTSLYSSGPFTIEKNHGFITNAEQLERLQEQLGDRLEILKEYYD